MPKTVQNNNAVNSEHNEGPKKDDVREIYEELKGCIMRREFLPDVKINQNQISKLFNVSRTPVVKALHMLKTEGLVDNIPNKGFYVHSASLHDTVELYELRQVVEMVAAANTAEYASLNDIHELAELFLPFTMTDHIDAVEYEKTDRQFHSRLIELSQNSLLQRTNQSIMVLPKSFTSGLLRNPQVTLQEHLDIVDALMRRDVRQAQLLAQKHVELTLKTLKNAMEGLRKIGVDPRKISITDVKL